MLKMYKIEIDGHFHGGPPPKPWVAKIVGVDPERFGLRREFVKAMNDWKNAHAAWSGNLYGVVATFPLHDGNLYEVSRCRGKSSKRYVAREFYSLIGGRMIERTPDEALAIAEGAAGPARVLEVRDDPDDRPWVAEVAGLGTPRRLGWVVVDGKRHYRLWPGRVYEVGEKGDRKLLTVEGDRIVRLTQKEALRLFDPESPPTLSEMEP
jgi:hypothetical protein